MQSGEENVEIPSYDCAIIGGGIAGLQAAVQLGRYRHKVLIVDGRASRASIAQGYHNILGWPDGISGPELLRRGREQVEKLGVEFVNDEVTSGRIHNQSFRLHAASGRDYIAKRVLIATGLSDNIPDVLGLRPCLGKTIYVCPDCDGYECSNQHTVVMGSGDIGANMALTLEYWTHSLVYINHTSVGLSGPVAKQLEVREIDYISQPISRVLSEDGIFYGCLLQDGRQVMGSRGFSAFGGNRVHSGIARTLGVQIQENGHITVDARTKLTNVPNVWAAGDVVSHSEQVTIAMGDGSQAAIWIHKSLL